MEMIIMYIFVHKRLKVRKNLVNKMNDDFLLSISQSKPLNTFEYFLKICYLLIPRLFFLILTYYIKNVFMV